MAVVAAAWWSGLLAVIQRRGLWAGLGWADWAAGLGCWAGPGLAINYCLILQSAADGCMLTLHQDIYSHISNVILHHYWDPEQQREGRCFS